MEEKNTTGVILEQKEQGRLRIAKIETDWKWLKSLANFFKMRERWRSSFK